MKQPNISNPKDLEKKIAQFKKDGAAGFHVVADFDRTLTMAFIKERAKTSYELIRAGNYLSSEYVKESYALYDIYRPLEISQKISPEEKNAKMIEWWTKHYELMVRSGMNMGVIKDIIKKGEIQIRGGGAEFLDILAKNNIPILILSAGVGDLIKEYLSSIGKLTENAHIVSNFFTFDKNGKAIGWLTPIIHSLNKNEVPIKDTPYYVNIKHRRNVLLLGDLLEDIKMTEGIDHDCIIKVGFFNENVKEAFDSYSKAFDVVITGDGPMGYVNSLLKDIL